jgi:hypothetical protein
MAVCIKFLGELMLIQVGELQLVSNPLLINTSFSAVSALRDRFAPVILKTTRRLPSLSTVPLQMALPKPQKTLRPKPEG